jgi:hypothetical protein
MDNVSVHAPRDTHTHTYIYIYIYTHTCGARIGHKLIGYTCYTKMRFICFKEEA